MNTDLFEVVDFETGKTLGTCKFKDDIKTLDKDCVFWKFLVDKDRNLYIMDIHGKVEKVTRESIRIISTM